jgi:hypothetical protein
MMRAAIISGLLCTAIVLILPIGLGLNVYLGVGLLCGVVGMVVYTFMDKP